MILGIHHVYEYTNHAPGDLAFLASGVISLAIGWSLIRAGSEAANPRGSEAALDETGRVLQSR